MHDASEHPPAATLNLAHRQFEREDGAVLAPARNLAADTDDFAHPRLAVVPQVGIVLAAVRFGHQHLDVLAHKLPGGVTEKPERGGVGFGDRALFVYGYDAVHRAVEYPPEPSFASISGGMEFAVRNRRFPIGIGNAAHRFHQLTGHNLRS